MPGTSTEQVVDKGIMQKSTKEWTHSLTAVSFVRGHRSVFPRTPRNTGVYTRHLTFVTATTSGVLTRTHGFRQNSKKKRNACPCTCTHAVRHRRSKTKLCVPYGLRSEGVNQDHFHFSLTPLSDSRTNCYSFLSKILGIMKSDASDISR